jgi:hypothetical protein
VFDRLFDRRLSNFMKDDTLGLERIEPQYFT